MISQYILTPFISKSIFFSQGITLFYFYERVEFVALTLQKFIRTTRAEDWCY